MPEAKKSTTVNYSPELTTKIVEAYQKGETDEERAQILEDLSAETGKGVKSLRQKLVREKVYIAKTYVSKAGKRTETKAAIVEGIARAMGVSSEVVESLEKATKPTLELMRGTLQVAREALDPQEDES